MFFIDIRQIEPNALGKMHIRPYEQQLMKYDEFRIYKFLLLYVPPIVIILGTFGNIFAFLILRRKAMLKFSTYYYLMVLAVADTLVLYVGLRCQRRGRRYYRPLRQGPPRPHRRRLSAFYHL